MLPEESLNSTPIDGIEILVTLAKTGKIDPWNIDIVEVTDQYLQILGELKSQDLKLTGKTLLYAAILLRMKSDSLSGVNFMVFEEPFDDGADGDFLELGLDSVAPASPLGKLALAFSSLDQVIRRRTSVKQPRNRKVTLNDLILELKKYEALEKKRRLKETVEKAERRRMRNFADLSSEEIVELAHEEFIEDTILSLKGILERFFLHDEAISLSQLETEGKIDRVSAYIAVLFLASRGEVDLQQEAFYSELYVAPQLSGTSEVTDEAPLDLAG
jgi:segregation and condensation protein A